MSTAIPFRFVSYARLLTGEGDDIASNVSFHPAGKLSDLFDPVAIKISCFEITVCVERGRVISQNAINRTDTFKPLTPVHIPNRFEGVNSVTYRDLVSRLGLLL
jgi:hypothetical protein